MVYVERFKLLFDGKELSLDELVELCENDIYNDRGSDHAPLPGDWQMLKDFGIDTIER